MYPVESVLLDPDPAIVPLRTRTPESFVSLCLLNEILKTRGRAELGFGGGRGSAPSGHDQGLWQVRGVVTLVGNVELDLAGGVALDDEVPHGSVGGGGGGDIDERCSHRGRSGESNESSEGSSEKHDGIALASSVEAPAGEKELEGVAKQEEEKKRGCLFNAGANKRTERLGTCRR